MLRLIYFSNSFLFSLARILRKFSYLKYFTSLSIFYAYGKMEWATNLHEQFYVKEMCKFEQETQDSLQLTIRCR